MNILLLQTKRIGDLILTTPVIAALRDKFPDATLTLIVSRESAPLLPAIAGVDRSLIVQRKWGDLTIFRTIAREKFDVCVDLSGNDRTALLTYLSRANKRIASNWIRVQSRRRGRAYNEFVPDRVGDLHTVDFHLSLLEPLGISHATPQVQLHLPEKARAAADSWLRREKINQEFVIFHPGSARAEKFWDAQRWADVIGHAQADRKMKTILTGGSAPLEQAHLHEIKQRLREPVLDLSGQIDLLVLAALIARARLLVTVDSAPMHLAAATGTPQVVLFGPTNPFHWRPRHRPALILQGDSSFPVTDFSPRQPPFPMNDISTEGVIGAMSSLLSTPAVQVS